MIIDLFKDKKIWNELENYNKPLLDIGSKFIYSDDWDKYKNGASAWLNPAKAKYIPVGRSYPNPHSASERIEYSLCIYLAYYLPIFLLNKLYSNNLSVAIEDLGAGDGKFFYYINKLGYNNFNLIEDFSQFRKELLDCNLKDISYNINQINTFKPTVVINNGCYHISANLAIRWIKTIELATCYTHELFDCQEFTDKLANWGYKFLCRDADNLAISFCRADKYDEFIDKLKEYKI